MAARSATRDWRTSRNGNPFLYADGYNIVVYPAGRAWGFRVTNRESSEAVSSRLPLPSLDVAKLRAFDAMIWMKQRGQQWGRCFEAENSVESSRSFLASREH